MHKVFEAKIKLRRLPLGARDIRALKNLKLFDALICTSKNAEIFFKQELRARKLNIPAHVKIIRVGPRKDLLKFNFKNKKILFPRSAKAPADIIKQLRARGAQVTALKLYEPLPVPLKSTERRALVSGDVKEIYFKSSSAIESVLGQLSAPEGRIIKSIAAVCIGTTTAAAARKAGFSKVKVKRL